MRLRLSIVALFFVGSVLLFNSTLDKTSGQEVAPAVSSNAAPTHTFPSDLLIDDFDKTIQERFITAPQFGIYRIAPRRPVNPHFEYFDPNTAAEKAAVDAFEINGWDVGIYLFGRKVMKRVDTKDDKYDIKYRLFSPIPVTKSRKLDLKDSEKLVDEIKQAFVDFQKRGSPNENEVRFSHGKWSYVARPVRAVNQSCVQCHKDNPVVLDRLGDGKFTIRDRRIGDANGVLVYAFARREHGPVQ